MPYKRRSIVAASVILIILSATVMCMLYLPSAGPTFQTLYIDEPYWPGSLNEFTNPYPNWQLYTVYQPLLTINGSLQQRTGKIQYVPVLAQSWSVSADQEVFTFNLRKVDFSSGDPFNAYQMWGQLYGLYYLYANSSYWWNGYPVFNMSAARFGPATVSLMDKSGLIAPSNDLLKIMQDRRWPIYVTGPYQIVFRIKCPFKWFLGTFIDFVGLAFDTQWVLDHGGFGSPAQMNTYFNLHPIPGTGPYVVDKVSYGQFVTFAKNPNYWGDGLTPAEVQGNLYIAPGYVQSVVIIVRPDDIARYTDLSTDQASIAAIESPDWSLVTSNPNKFGYAVLPPNPGLVIAIAMNTHRYPTNITAVRQAIEHAINLTDINKAVYFGTLSPWIGPEYPTFSDFYNLSNFPGYQYNLTLSKQILARGDINESQLPPLEFSVLAGCIHCINTAQIVQADLAQIGINVDIQVLPIAEFLSAPPNAGSVSYNSSLITANQDSQLTWFGTATFGMTAITPADLLLEDVNGNAPCCNYAVYSNPLVQACIDGFFSEASVNQLQSICFKAQQQIDEDAPYIWIGAPTLPLADGSIAYSRFVISGFLLDPTYTGQTDTAIFNTVTFTNGQ